MTVTRRRPKRWSRLAAAVFTGAALLLGVVPATSQISSDNAYDTSLPIEISADALEVQRDAGVAIFRGSVDAVQGEMSLRADQLTVKYSKGAEGPNAISLIDAEGNVFLSTPTEMAQGDRGVYDVEANTLELVGTVVLTRGENIVRGNRLTLNLATGKSKMESGTARTGERERVKALFVPKSVQQ